MSESSRRECVGLRTSVYTAYIPTGELDKSFGNEDAIINTDSIGYERVVGTAYAGVNSIEQLMVAIHTELR